MPLPTTAVSFTSAPASQSAILNPSINWGGLSNSSRILSIAVAPFYQSNFTLAATYFNGSACTGVACGVDMTVVIGTTNSGTSWFGPHLLSGALSANGTQMGGTQFDVNGAQSGYRSTLTGLYDAAIQIGGASLYAWPSASCPTWTTPASSTPTTGECGTFSGPGGTPTWTLWGRSQVELSSRDAGSTTSATFTEQNTTASTTSAKASWTLWFMGNPYKANGSANITVTNVPVGLPMAFNSSTCGCTSRRRTTRAASAARPRR